MVDEDEVLNRDEVQMLKEKIEEHAMLNHFSMTAMNNVIFDFFFGDEDTSPLDRINNGKFGSSLIYNPYTGMVESARMRFGEANPGENADQFIVGARFSQVVTEARPPDADIETDLGDFEQGILHVRMEGDIPPSEFTQFLDRLLIKIEQKRDWMEGRDL